MALPEGLKMDYLLLESHPSARNKASARLAIKPGQTIISVPSLVTALSSSEKGRRCDHCHRLSSDRCSLLKCTGCAAFWYCGVKCQTAQWKAHHRRICKSYNRYTASPHYQALSPNEQVDAVLLSQLVAQLYSDDVHMARPEDRDACSIFANLMVGPNRSAGAPPLCTSHNFPRLSATAVHDLFSRFGNNNFIVHSHLTAFAHGIFPLASRLFNHSCTPNSVAKYIITPTQTVTMEIIALCEIMEGAEVTIPYLDPALPFDTRQMALLSNYGFQCECSLCLFEGGIHPVPSLPENPIQLSLLERELCAFSLACPEGGGPLHSARSAGIFSMPSKLYSLLNVSYLPQISETFSRASHDGPYDVALSVGCTLLALYIALYPSNYPQIGMHALEMTKTAWNAVVADHGNLEDVYGSSAVGAWKLVQDASSYLAIASSVLNNFGAEGDDGGPLEEIRVMRELLSTV